MKKYFTLINKLPVNLILYDSSQMKGVSSHREHNPMKAKVILAFYALLSCLVRVCAVIAYFAATLGLFNLLRHLQGSQEMNSSGFRPEFGQNHNLHVN